MGSNRKKVSSEENLFEHLIESSGAVLTLLHDRSDELEDILLTLNSSKKEIEGQIEQCFQTIFRCLEDRRRNLIKDLEESLSRRRVLVENLHKEIEGRSQQITINIEIIKQSNISQNGPMKSGEKRNGGGQELLGQRNVIMEQLRKDIGLTVPMHPSSTDILSYFPIDLDQLLSIIKSFGAIGITSIDADQTVLDKFANECESNIIRCSVNEIAVEKIQTVDLQGRKVSLINPDEFAVSLVPRLPQANEATVIFDVSENNSVGVRLNLYYPGMYDFNVKVLGEHIRGSPYRLQCTQAPGPEAKKWKKVFKEISLEADKRLLDYKKLRRCNSAKSIEKKIKPPTALADKLNFSRDKLVFTTGTRGRGLSEFGCPQGVCFTRDSKIVVADSNNANIQIFDITGALLTRFGEFGSDPGQIVRPKDVAETINSNYLVCDFDGHCIHVFQPCGNYMSSFGRRHLAGPTSVAVDSKGKIFVVDKKACTVYYFKPTGRYLGQFGSRGPGEQQFMSPTGVAIDSMDQLYVTDSLSHCLKVFSNEGVFIYKFGANGVEPGFLHQPTYLCFDTNDKLYVCDTGNSRIQVFDKNGQFLHLLTSTLEDLNDPQGIAISSIHQMAVVADSGNFRIKAFRISVPSACPEKQNEF